MNIVTHLKNRIAKDLLTTKTPCKFYKTESTAEKAAIKTAEQGAMVLGVEEVNYIIIYVPEVEKYTPCFDLNRAILQGGNGNMVFFANKDFYSF